MTSFAAIPARIPPISAAVKKLHPEPLGVHPKTFANHRANARAALLWFNRAITAGGRRAPMAEEYRVLWEAIADRHAKEMLSPFFRFLSGCGVAPGSVNDSHVERYMAYRRETSFARVTLSQQRALIRHWNHYAGEVSGWPKAQLSEPQFARRFAGPAWEDFPEGLRADIDAYCARVAKRHKSADGRTMPPCQPGTIETRKRELIAAVRAAVAAGLPLQHLTRLRDLLHPDRVEAIIDHYWHKNGERPSLYTMDLGWKFLALARAEESFDAADLQRLDEIRLALDQFRSKGLTQKTRASVHQVIQGGVWDKVIQLPDMLMAEARAARRHMPVKAAVTAQLAVAIRLLTVAPVRMQNLATICVDTNLIRPAGPGGCAMLVFPDYDVKNGVNLEFELDEATTAMVDAYIFDYRPRLLRGCNHDLLFAGLEGGKGPKTLSGQISQRLWKTLGLSITPHQFRHAAAALILKAEPGNYELVRRVLGHKNIQTTIDFYIGLETISATRRFAEIITAAEPRKS